MNSTWVTESLSHCMTAPGEPQVHWISQIHGWDGTLGFILRQLQGTGQTVGYCENSPGGERVVGLEECWSDQWVRSTPCLTFKGDKFSNSVDQYSSRPQAPLIPIPGHGRAHSFLRGLEKVQGQESVVAQERMIKSGTSILFYRLLTTYQNSPHQTVKESTKPPTTDDPTYRPL